MDTLKNSLVEKKKPFKVSISAINIPTETNLKIVKAFQQLDITSVTQNKLANFPHRLIVTFT